MLAVLIVPLEAPFVMSVFKVKVTIQQKKHVKYLQELQTVKSIKQHVLHVEQAIH